MTVRRDLHSIANAFRAVAHELFRPSQIASADEIADAKFCVRVERRPRPHIAPADCLFLWASVLCLGAYVLPNLVTLQPPHLEIADIRIMVGGARIGQIKQELYNGILGNTRPAHRRTDGVPFDQGRDNLLFLRHCQPFHILNYMLERASCQVKCDSLAEVYESQLVFLG